METTIMLNPLDSAIVQEAKINSNRRTVTIHYYCPICGTWSEYSRNSMCIAHREKCLKAERKAKRLARIVRKGTK